MEIYFKNVIFTAAKISVLKSFVSTYIFRTTTHLNVMIERLKISALGQCFEELRLSGNTTFCSNVEQNMYQYEIVYENGTLIIFYEKVEQGSLRQGGYFWLHITGNTGLYHINLNVHLNEQKNQLSINNLQLSFNLMTLPMK